MGQSKKGRDFWPKGQVKAKAEGKDKGKKQKEKAELICNRHYARQKEKAESLEKCQISRKKLIFLQYIKKRAFCFEKSGWANGQKWVGKNEGCVGRSPSSYNLNRCYGQKNCTQLPQNREQIRTIWFYKCICAVMILCSKTSKTMSNFFV